MSKHTPGPWGIERDGVTLTMGNQIVATAIAPDGSGIDEQRANARLISAAPELLEALRKIEDAMPSLRERRNIVEADVRVMRIIRSALAKVCGGESGQ